MSTSPQATESLGDFNYGSLQSLMVFFAVDHQVVRPLVQDAGLEVADFGGTALVNLNFERYSGFGSTFSSYVDEVEFNVVVYPPHKASQRPALTVAQYLAGQDQSKTYGNFRVNVPCDSATAVTAGSEKYGEIKFVASFTFKVPDVNDPTVTTYWVRCYATETAPSSQLPYIFDLKFDPDAAGAPARSVSAFSPVPAYATLQTQKGTQMVTSARVVFGVFDSWIPPAPAGAAFGTLPPGMATVVVGEASHVMQQQMQQVFGSNPPAVGALLFESTPAAASGHTLLSDPIPPAGSAG